MTDEEILSADVLPVFYNWLGKNEHVPQDLIGSTILRMGTFPSTRRDFKSELIIDYMPIGSNSPRRIVLGFSEYSMHVKLNEEARCKSEGEGLAPAPQSKTQTVAR